MKFDRHSQIIKIIREHDIETQEELAEALRSKGIEVTQATVSRDIKELRLVKVLNSNGVYKYAVMNNNENGLSQRLIRVFSESVVSIDYANNMIVIKTISAGAQAAAATIDSLKWDEIVGCIAGDDTILIIVRTQEAVQDIISKFKNIMK